MSYLFFIVLNTYHDCIKHLSRGKELKEKYYIDLLFNK